MHARAVVLAIVAGKCIRVRSLESNTVFPKALLRFTNRRRRRAFRRIADLSDEPGEIPTGIASRFANDMLEQPAVIIACDLVFGFLIGIRFTLVPEQSPKATGAQLVNAFHQSIKKFAGAFQIIWSGGHEEFRIRRRYFNALALGKPLPHAGGAVAHAGHCNGNVVSLIERIAEGRNKAAFRAMVLDSWLRIVGDAPGVSAERNHHARFGLLADLAVVGGVGLARDYEDFSNANVGNLGFKDRFAGFQDAKLKLIKSSSGYVPLGAKGVRCAIERQALPLARQR